MITKIESLDNGNVMLLDGIEVISILIAVEALGTLSLRDDVVTVSKDVYLYPEHISSINGEAFSGDKNDLLLALSEVFSKGSSSQESGTETEGNMENKAVLTTSKDGDIYSIDGKQSGEGSGSVSGIHIYVFNGKKQTVDLLSQVTVPAELVDGGNTTISSINNFIKNITGNSWNSSAYSSNGFSASIDFACSWSVESITGTIREVAGLNLTPNESASYTKIDFAIYQVDANVFVYEKGVSKGSNLLPFNMSAGDRLGIKIIDSEVFYFHLRDGNETIFYKSEKQAQGVYFFDSSLNSGSASSGPGNIEDVVFHTAQKETYFNVKIEGSSLDELSSEHKEILKKEGGIEVLESSNYSEIRYTRSLSVKYDFDIDVTYWYFNNLNAITETIEK